LKLNWSGDVTPNAVLFAKLAAPAMPTFGTLDISGGTFGSQGKLGPQVLRLERNTLQTTRTRIGFATGTSAEVSVAGVLDQTGGSHLTGSLLMGADGHYILRGGTLNAGSVEGFASSSFTMEGGMLNLSGAMAVGRLDLSGGHFSFTGPSVTAGALNMGLKLNPSPDPVLLRVGAGQSVEVTGLLKVGVLTPGTLIVDAGDACTRRRPCSASCRPRPAASSSCPAESARYEWPAQMPAGATTANWCWAAAPAGLAAAGN